MTHWKRPWCWERLKAGGEAGDRGWDGWMASPTQWTWVWVGLESWWWTGKPGVLQSMGSQRVGHNWAIELNWRIMVSLSESQLVVSDSLQPHGLCPWNSSGQNTGMGRLSLLLKIFPTQRLNPGLVLESLERVRWTSYDGIAINHGKKNQVRKKDDIRSDRCVI